MQEANLKLFRSYLIYMIFPVLLEWYIDFSLTEKKSSVSRCTYNVILSVLF